MPFQNLPDESARSMRDLAARTLTVKPLEISTFCFNTSQIRRGQEPKELIEKVAKWSKGGGKFIYYFETSASPVDCEKLCRAVGEVRQQKLGDRSYARLHTASPVLYVGSSSSLRSRFREHLGYASKSVFAMQLAYWAEAADVEISFTAARYDERVDDDVLGALEDQLWSKFKPMLGRQGRR